MKPIVSPWMIYLIALMDPLKVFFITAAIALVIITLNIYFTILCAGEITQKEYTILIRRGVKLICICTFFAVFLPSSETTMQMAVANIVTVDNVNSVFQIIQDAAAQLLGEV